MYTLYAIHKMPNIEIFFRCRDQRQTHKVHVQRPLMNLQDVPQAIVSLQVGSFSLGF